MDAVETYAGPKPWWIKSSKTVKSKTILNEGQLLTKAEMQEASGLDWTVSTQPVFVTGEHAQQIKGYRAVVRDSDGQVFGIVSDEYKTIQNEVIFDLPERVIDESDVAHFETAGALFNGKIVWSMLSLGAKGGIRIAGDPSPYDLRLLVSTGHDGRHALRADTTLERVTCANTLKFAQKGAKDSISLKHTTNAEWRIGEVRQALKISFDYLETFEKVAAELMKVELTSIDADAFLEKLLPFPPQAETSVRITNQRDAIKNLFNGSANLDGVGKNGYRMVQAVAEWTDHEKSFGQRDGAEDRRALAILEGSSYNLKGKAVKLLVPSAI